MEILLSGEIKWSNNLFKPDDKYGPPVYKLNLYPDETSRAIYDESGIRVKFKEDENGEFLILSRKHNPVVFNDKVMSPGGPPEVVDKDGKPWDTSKLIGNGSKVTAKIEVYETKKFGIGHRVLKVRIDDLIEYNPDKTVKEPMPF